MEAALPVTQALGIVICFRNTPFWNIKQGGTILLASFLVVRKVDPNVKFPLESSSDIPPKPKSKSKSKKKDKEKEAGGSSTPAPEKEAPKDQDKKDGQPADSKPNEGEAAKEETPKKDDSNLKEYYQPLTLRFYSNKPATLEPLSRIVKPVAEVQKYMEEVMDRAERAPTGFLAFCLPREAKTAAAIVDESAATSVAPEDARSKTAAVSEVEDADNNNMANETEFEEFDDELKDFYDSPSGLSPMQV